MSSWNAWKEVDEIEVLVWNMLLFYFCWFDYEWVKVVGRKRYVLAEVWSGVNIEESIFMKVSKFIKYNNMIKLKNK